MHPAIEALVKIDLLWRRFPENIPCTLNKRVKVWIICFVDWKKPETDLFEVIVHLVCPFVDFSSVYILLLSTNTILPSISFNSFNHGRIYLYDSFSSITEYRSTSRESDKINMFALSVTAPPEAFQIAF